MKINFISVNSLNRKKTNEHHVAHSNLSPFSNAVGILAAARFTAAPSYRQGPEIFFWLKRLL
jgi:hypothetical protein